MGSFAPKKIINLGPAGHRSPIVEVGIFHIGGELLPKTDGKLKNRVGPGGKLGYIWHMQWYTYNIHKILLYTAYVGCMYGNVLHVLVHWALYTVPTLCR